MRVRSADDPLPAVADQPSSRDQKTDAQESEQAATNKLGNHGQFIIGRGQAAFPCSVWTTQLYGISRQSRPQGGFSSIAALRRPINWAAMGKFPMIARVISILETFARDESGGEVLEYALVAGLIVVAAISLIKSVGTKVLARWTSLNSSM
jgi:Flp pilus assembly pilin Flp